MALSQDEFQEIRTRIVWMVSHVIESVGSDIQNLDGVMAEIHQTLWGMLNDEVDEV